MDDSNIPWQLSGPRWQRIVLYGTLAWVFLGSVALFVFAVATS